MNSLMQQSTRLFFLLRTGPALRLPGMRVALGILLVGLAGCATGSFSMVATIAGGERIAVPVGPNGAEPAHADGVQVELASFSLNAEKNFVYTFEFSDAKRRALRGVRIEDVSDTKPFALVEDAQPVVPAGGRWRGESRPLAASEPGLSWIQTISNTLRVFRLTLTFADGRTLTLHQGSLYPAGSKGPLRQALGMKY
jgi:hypothetical protein